MSESDKKPLDDFDWDAALAEWDKQPFSPEVAAEKKAQEKAKEAEKAAAAAADPKPLYRPPMKTMDPASAQVAAPPKPPPPPPPPVPRKRGGLGQLFSRPEPRKPGAPEEPSVDVFLEEPVARKHFRAEDDEDGVVTSAVDVETVGGDIEDALQAAAEEVPAVADGAMFDPFAEPDRPRSAPPTPPPAPAPAPIAPPRPPSVPPISAPPPTPAVAVEPLPPSEPVRVPSVSSEVEELHEFEAPKLPSIAPPAISEIEDERPAASWLDEETLASLRERAVWLETEARNVLDKVGSAKMLLAVSELRAIVGDLDEALALATEARQMAPHLGLAHRQVRTLGPRDASVVAALDDELRHAPGASAKLHATLYAAQAIASGGDADGAAKRYDAAARFAPTDATVVLARALRALAKGELTNAALKLPDAPVLAPLATALSAILRARGALARDAEGSGGALDILERARGSLEKGDIAAAVDRLGELAATQPGADGSEPVLARGARWMASAFAAVRAPTRRKAVELLEALAKGGDELAPRALAARATELGDAETAARAIAAGGSFAPADRVSLAALLGFKNDRDEHDIAALMSDEAGAALAAAAARKEDAAAYLERIAGAQASRSAVRIGRLLAGGTDDLDSAADAAESHAPAFARALRIESARRTERHEEVVAALASWGAGGAQRSLASALVAERARLVERAAAGYRAAFESEPLAESAARAAAVLEDPSSLPASLASIAAQATDPIRAALLELEAFLRAPHDDAATGLAVVEKIHRHAPHLPFATFLAQRIARRAGDEAAVVHWLHERQKAITDPLERALDLVREAWLIADTDAAGASARLDEAHRLRPDDIALRELHERLSAEPLTDRATWREQRALSAKGRARDLMLIEAAYEHERAGDPAAALAAAKAADADGKGSGLARIALERAELLAGDAARLADTLLSHARTAESVEERREAYERLADLDATARNDPASAVLWHRTILEESPRHKPSLRHVEHALLGERRDDELEPVLAAVAHALDQTGGECDAHAQVGARFRMRAGDWDGTREYADLGAKQPAPTMWALRLRNAHARAANDDAVLLESTLALIDRAARPIEIATLSLRGAEAAARKNDLELAEKLAERATATDPADVVAWKQLAVLRQQRGESAGAAEAYESLARTAGVDEHRLAAWYAAGSAHTDEARAISALEQAASIDVTYQDIFHKLSKLYAQRGMRGELASLLERRIATVLDPEERLTLEVDRGRALAEAEDFDAAREAYDAALALQPDHVGALTAMGDLCAARKDWEAAEQVWVRLARLLATPEEQLTAYRRLGDLYATHLNNMSRAEVAYREVLKRAPDDVDVRERLVEVYKKQNDAPRALEIQQELLASAQDPDTKRKRLIGLSSIHETASRDLRKAEQTLEAARREFPSDVGILRALAEFYIRHKQTPAVNILLDRAAGDTRRAFAGGRFSTPLFETMVAVYELRGKQDAARVVSATLAAWSGEPSALGGAEGRAFDPRVDELLVSDMVGPAARTLLARTGHALDAATALDVRALGATPMLQGEPLARLAAGMAQAANIGAGIQILVSPQLGHQCVASGDARQPALVVGPDFPELPELPRTFLMLRAFKLMQVRGSAFSRAAPAEVPVIVAAWLRAYAPSYAPPGIPPQALAEATRRIQSALPKPEPDLGLAALEVAGAVGPQLGLLGGAILAWANHTALLGIGDLGAALDGLAYGSGPRGGTPPPVEERAAWISRTPEAKDLVAFSVSDGYTEARIRLGIR